MTSEQLVEISPKVDVLFPEVYWSNWHGRAWTNHEQVDIASDLIGKTTLTVSPIIIDTILCEVRMGRLRSTDVELYCNGNRVEINPSGVIIDDWANEFLEN
jgi:hypothetical protein